MRILFALFIAIPLTSNALEMRKRYLVKATSGTVLGWPPSGSGWVKLGKGDYVWEDSLIQVSKGARITFSISLKEGFKDLKAEEAEISLNSPILTRLHSGISRPVALNDYFIQKLPDLVASNKKETALYESFNEAWSRVAAYMVPQSNRGPSGGARSGAEDPFSQSVRAKKIRLFSPAQGMMVISRAFPQEVRVSWKEIPETGANYEIRLWEPAKPRPQEPTITTQFDHYSLGIPQEGAYLIQVTAQNGRFQSEVHQFHALLPMEGRASPASRTQTGLPIMLELPPRGFSHLTKKWPISTTFSWEKPAFFDGEPIYTFVLSDREGKELMKKDTSEPFFSVKFGSPGTYQWFVSARNTELPSAEGHRPSFSEVRAFSIGSAPEEKNPVEALFKDNHERVYYLESGL